MSNKTQYYVEFADGTIIETSFPEYHPTGNVLPKISGERAYIEQLKTGLIEVLKDFKTIYCVIRHVSASGMSREISLYSVDNEKRMIGISYTAGKIIGWGQGKLGGIKVRGCGMDMAFHTVYTLSSILYDNAGILKSEII